MSLVLLFYLLWVNQIIVFFVPCWIFVSRNDRHTLVSATSRLMTKQTLVKSISNFLPQTGPHFQLQPLMMLGLVGKRYL